MGDILGIFGILLSLALLIALAYRGISGITTFIICGLTHRKSYKDLGMVTLVIPFTVVNAVTVLMSFFGKRAPCPR